MEAGGVSCTNRVQNACKMSETWALLLPAICFWFLSSVCFSYLQFCTFGFPCDTPCREKTKCTKRTRPPGKLTMRILEVSFPHKQQWPQGRVPVWTNRWVAVTFIQAAPWSTYCVFHFELQYLRIRLTKSYRNKRQLPPFVNKRPKHVKMTDIILPPIHKVNNTLGARWLTPKKGGLFELPMEIVSCRCPLL